MQKINFQNLPSTSTPINATNLNTIQSNVEDVFNGDEPMGNIVVDSIRSKNMLNPSISISGAIASNSTSEATDGSSSAITSGWMPCKPNTTYTMSGGYNRSRWQSKAENGTITFISDNQTTITTNSTAKWIRVYFYYNSGGAINPTSITNVQVEEGSTATSYSPYQDLNNQEIYSTGEIKIGTWINGKPLYKKVIQGTTADGDISIDLSYLHIDTLVNIGGTAGSNGDFKPINFDYFGYSISTRYSLGMMYVNASTPYANIPFNIVIEYTKTTD